MSARWALLACPDPLACPVNAVLMVLAVPKAPLDCPVYLVLKVLLECKALPVLAAFLASPVFQALQAKRTLNQIFVTSVRPS